MTVFDATLCIGNTRKGVRDRNYTYRYYHTVFGVVLLVAVIILISLFTLLTILNETRHNVHEPIPPIIQQMYRMIRI